MKNNLPPKQPGTDHKKHFAKMPRDKRSIAGIAKPQTATQIGNMSEQAWVKAKKKHGIKVG